MRVFIRHLEDVSSDERNRHAFLFWKWYVLNCNTPRDSIMERVDTALLHYFHSYNLLTFLSDVCHVPCSHANKYELSVDTRYGPVQRAFSSVREVKSATGLDFRKELRKILYK